MKRWMGLVLLGGCALSAVAGCSNDTETAATGATSGQSSSSGAGGASSSSGGTTTSTGANSGGGGAGSGGSSTGGSSSGGDVTMGLVAYYPFDGNADDASGNNHHGNVVGATFGADVGGTAMSALSVSTATDFVDVGDIAAFDFGSGSLSLTYWFKTASAKAYLGVLANGCGRGQRHRPGG
jgi:hypothetical protein